MMQMTDWSGFSDVAWMRVAFLVRPIVVRGLAVPA